MEGDSSFAINWINVRSSNGGHYEILIHDIKVWIDLIEDFLCSHILHEGNMVADYMTGVGSRGTSIQFTRECIQNERRR